MSICHQKRFSKVGNLLQRHSSAQKPPYCDVTAESDDVSRDFSLRTAHDPSRRKHANTHSPVFAVNSCFFCQVNRIIELFLSFQSLCETYICTRNLAVYLDVHVDLSGQQKIVMLIPQFRSRCFLLSSFLYILM